MESKSFLCYRVTSFNDFCSLLIERYHCYSTANEPADKIQFCLVAASFAFITECLIHWHTDVQILVLS